MRINVKRFILNTVLSSAVPPAKPAGFLNTLFLVVFFPKPLPFSYCLLPFLKTCLAALFFLFASCDPANAQKVGLVLSGGGAKGLAHVGVIRALEENNIPIDYIVGTSMGGVVGALYASGYSAAEIDYIVRTEEFQNWASGKQIEDLRYNFNDEEDNAGWFRLNLSVDSAFQAQIRNTLINDLNLNFALNHVFAQSAARANYNFDKLFVPFRCVAADIFSQEQVVLGKGSLADAVRATLTVPLVYRPIRIDNRFLFDGGVYNNFPANVAISTFKPDVVIGVNVSSKNYTKYPYGKDEQLLSKTLLYLMLSKSDSTTVGKNGIYLQPNLMDFTSLDFGSVDAIVKAGYDETIARIEDIKKSIPRQQTSETLRARRDAFTSGFLPLNIRNINITGLTEKQASYVRKFFSKESELYTLADIKKGYYRLAADQSFSNIYPHFRINPKTNSFDFDLDISQRNGLSLDVGGTLASRPIDNVYAGLTYQFLRRYLYTFNINFNSGRFYQAIQLRSRITIPGKLPITVEPEFTSNNWSFLRTSGFLIRDEQPAFIEQKDETYRLNLGFTTNFKDQLVLSGGYVRLEDQYSNRVEVSSADKLDKTVFKGYSPAFTYRRSTLNYKQYATSGFALTGQARYINGTEFYFPGSTSLMPEPTSHKRNWLKLKGTYERFFGVGKHHWGYLAETVISNQPLFTNYRSSVTFAPAFNPLPESKTLFLDNFRSYNYLGLGLRYIYSLSPKIDFRTEGFVFQPYKSITEQEEQKAVLTKRFSETHLIGSSTLVYHSFVGPVALQFSYYDDPAKDWGILFHIGYLIFHNKALD